MKFTEEKLERAFVELPGKENYPPSYVNFSYI